MNTVDLSNISYDATITGLSAAVSGKKPPMKTVTYRIGFIAPGMEDGDDGNGPIIRGRTWEQVLDEKIEAGATFVHVRFHAGYDQLTVREPV